MRICPETTTAHQPNQTKMTTPARRGHAWTQQEEDTILAYVEAGMSFAEIAETQQRTTGSIRCRLTRIACSYVEKGHMSVYEAAGRTGVRVSDIRDAIREADRNRYQAAMDHVGRHVYPAIVRHAQMSMPGFVYDMMSVKTSGTFTLTDLLQAIRSCYPQYTVSLVEDEAVQYPATLTSPATQVRMSGIKIAWSS